MSKSYEQKMKAFKATCINHAQLETVYVKYEINSERADVAGNRAKNAARWIFTAFPELREK
jgi:hypothetical protein